MQRMKSDTRRKCVCLYDLSVHPSLPSHAAAELYTTTLGPDTSDSSVLDLCSSWSCHLPANQTFKQLVGHGMNRQELEANQQLTSWFVQVS